MANSKKTKNSNNLGKLFYLNRINNGIRIGNNTLTPSGQDPNGNREETKISEILKNTNTIVSSISEIKGFLKIENKKVKKAKNSESNGSNENVTNTNLVNTLKDISKSLLEPTMFSIVGSLYGVTIKKVNEISNLKPNEKSLFTSVNSIKESTKRINDLYDLFNGTDESKPSYFDIIDGVMNLATSDDINKVIKSIKGSDKESNASNNIKSTIETYIGYVVDAVNRNNISKDIKSILDTITGNVQNGNKLSNTERDTNNKQSSIEYSHIITFNDDAKTIFNNALEALKNINKSSGKPTNCISSITQLIESLAIIHNINDVEDIKNKLQIISGNDDTSIISYIKKISENLKNIDSLNKNQLDGISGVLNSIASIGSVDEASMKTSIKNLKILKKLTARPNILSKVGISNRGLLYTIMDNIVRLGNDAQQKGKGSPHMSLLALSSFLKTICEMGEKHIDTDAIESSIRALDLVIGMYSEGGEFYELIDTIVGFEKKIDSTYETVKNVSDKLKNMFNGLQTSADIIDFDRLGQISKGLLALTGISAQLYLLNKITSHIKESDIDNTKTALIGISYIIDYVNELDEIKDWKKLFKIELIFTELMALGTEMMFVNAFAKLGNKGINHTISMINNIQNIVSTINGTNDLANAGIRSSVMRKLLTNLLTVELAGIAAGALAPTATRGLNKLNQNVDEINKLVTDIANKIDLNDVKDSSTKLKEVAKIIVGLSGISLLASAMIGPFAIGLAGLWLLEKSIGIIQKIVNKVGQIKVEDDTFDNMKKAGIIIGVSSMLLLFVAGVGMFVLKNIIPILAFTGILSLFIIAVGKAYTMGTSDMKEIKDAALEFALIVTISAEIMLIGGAVTMMFPWVVPGIIIFGVLLATFIEVMSFVYGDAIENLKDNIGNVKLFERIVVGSAAIMMIGALFMATGLWVEALEFTVVLAGYVLAMSLVFKGVAMLIGDKTLKSMDQFAILIAACAATMAIGALFMMIPGFWKAALSFALINSLYVFLILGSFTLFSKFGGKKAIKAAKQFAILIATCAGSLIIGGLFMMIPGMKEAVISFAWTLRLFIADISIVFAIASRIMNKKAMTSVLALVAIIAVSSICMLTAGMMMIAYPELGDGINSYLWHLAVLVGGMAAICFILGLPKIKKYMAIGEGLMAGILALIWGANKVMKAIIEGVNEVGGQFDQMDAYIDRMTNIIWKFMGMIGLIATFIAAGAIAGTAFTGSAAGAALGAAAVTAGLAAAEALLGGIIKLIDMSASAMSSIADSMIKFNDVEPIDTEVVLGNIATYVAMLPELALLSTSTVMLWAAKYNVGLMSEIVSNIAGTIHNFASMTIPLYVNGKEVGKRPFDKKDIENAGENIKKILNTVGGAIISLYKEDAQKPEKERVFGGNFLTDFLGIDTVFSRVAKSCANLGIMVSEISMGIHDMAELKIPVYVNGRNAGYRQMNDNDFKLASDNIGKIITTIGTAICKIYNEDPNDMFKDQSWIASLTGKQDASNNKFSIVIRSCMGLGKLISSTAKGLKDVADFRIPIYKGNQVVGYHTLQSTDLTQVGDNVKAIITCLAQGVINAYNSGKTKNGVNLFDDPSKWYEPGNRAPIAMAMKTFNGIGKVLSEMVKGLQDMINMKVPVYDKNGNIIQGKFRSIDINDFNPKTGKVGKLIRTVIETIPQTLIDIYNAHIQDGWWKVGGFMKDAKDDNKFAVIKASLTGISAIVSDQIKGINEIMNMKIDMKDTASLQSKINYIMTAIPDAIQQAITIKNTGELKAIFGDDIDEELIEGINNKYKKFKTITETSIASFNSIIELMNKKVGDSNVDIDTIKEKLKTIIKVIPETFIELLYKDKEQEKRMFMLIGEKNISNSIMRAYKNYADGLSNIIEQYNAISEQINGGMQYQLTDLIIQNMFDSVKNVDVLSTETISKLNHRFVTSMECFSNGMNYLKNAFTEFPVIDTESYKYMGLAIDNVNGAINKINNVHKFTKETESLEKFVHSVNDIDLQKTSAMTEMISALDRMAEKMEGLDKFTKTIANDLANVLNHLTNELKQSAYTINKAEKIQRDRHKNIQESIYKINSLLNNPVNVIVTSEDGTTSEDSSPDDNTSTSFNTSTATSSAKGSSTITFTDSKAGEDNTMNMIDRLVQKLSGKDTSDNTSKPSPSKGRGSSKSK